MRAALLQLCSSDDPDENIPVMQGMLRQAAREGAQLVVTPEVSNCVSASRTRQAQVLRTEAQDQTLSALQAEAKALGLWVLIGSLALKTEGPDGRFANRSFLIGPDGAVLARYDKIHMFDVEVRPGEVIRESDGYRPGSAAVLAETPLGKIGMTICYDMRFARLYRHLAQAGAQIITVPSAFHPVTGAAHWHVLLRARAIETGAFVLAPAQTGTHAATRGRARTAYGHSLVVSPWGEVLADGGDKPGVVVVDLDLAEVELSRTRVPSLTHDREFKGV